MIASFCIFSVVDETYSALKQNQDERKSLVTICDSISHNLFLSLFVLDDSVFRPCISVFFSFFLLQRSRIDCDVHGNRSMIDETFPSCHRNDLQISLHRYPNPIFCFLFVPGFR